ncbi:MAG: hypothetical protein GY697_04045 [Desulfobacterales bacterium]|nr:hypothetical protein [Desulfobacterales bacterium]
MPPPVAIVGIGELGGVFARAFLHAGHPVYPVTRAMPLNLTLDRIPSPALTLIATGEKDLPGVLGKLVRGQRTSVGLLQNELLPKDWQSNGVTNPTVISVWFEKKKGMDIKVLRPSPLFGPRADLMAEALEGIGVPCRRLDSAGELLKELVIKNVFVYMINICGLKTGGTTGILWEKHTDLARRVADDIIDLQAHLTGASFFRDELLQGVVAGIEGDPEHKCMGRSAPARLSRFIAMADKAGVAARTIRAIQAEIGVDPI